jgi:pyrroloquinoline quinone biosynthesis protein B
LVNASPDLAAQVVQFLDHPVVPDSGLRFSPIASVLLTNADLDHCLGLFALREGPELRVIAPDGVRLTLMRSFHLDQILGAFNGIRWGFASTDWFPLDATGLEARAVPLEDAGPPRFDPVQDSDDTRCHGVGWQFRQRDSDRILGIFPDVARIDSTLASRLAECAVLFFDGTFWSEDEMPRLGLGTRSAREMGHVPLSGGGGSIDHLTRLTETQVWFTHINNTNPILRSDSAERVTVETAGLHVAEDGLTLRI